MAAIKVSNLNQLIEASDRLTRLKRNIQKALQTRHIMDVTEEFIEGFENLPDQTLQKLGIAVDILRSFERHHNKWKFNYSPSMPGFQLLAESASLPLHNIRLQIPSSPHSVSIGLKLLHDMLSGFEADTRFLLSLDKKHNASAIQNLLNTWKIDSSRTTLVDHDTRNLFAQDNAVTGILHNGDTVLMFPRPESNLSDDSSIDKPFENFIAETGIKLCRSRLFWEGGNILFDGQHCLIGANTIAKNMCQLGLSESEVLTAFSAEFRVKAGLAGNIETACQNEIKPVDNLGGQADFHIDLDITLLGTDPLTAQPLAGIAASEPSDKLMAALLKADHYFENHFVDKYAMKEIYIDHAEKSRQRRKPLLENYRETLQEKGYSLITLPDFRLLAEHNLFGRINTSFNYTNVIPSADSNGNRRVHLLRYGIDEIDQQAAAIYQSSGIRPNFIGNSVTANELLQLQGGLHCLYSKMG